MLEYQINYAKSWLIDCFPEEKETILSLTIEEVKDALNYYYVGGFSSFLESLDQ
jgi:hypothetical protein